MHTHTHKYTHTQTHTHKHTHTNTHTSVVDAMWETGETWRVEREKKRSQERVGSVADDPDNLENSKEAGGKHNVPRA